MKILITVRQEETITRKVVENSPKEYSVPSRFTLKRTFEGNQFKRGFRIQFHNQENDLQTKNMTFDANFQDQKGRKVCERSKDPIKKGAKNLKRDGEKLQISREAQTSTEKYHKVSNASKKLKKEPGTLGKKLK